MRAAVSLLAAACEVIVERHQIRAPAPPPPSLPVPDLVDDDAVNPGAEDRLSTEARKGPEDTQEDLLRDIESIVAVTK
jgi:hypothetical protein